MIAAVLDTNVLVSGLGWPNSIPGRILDALIDGRFMAITSPALLDELRRVLLYPRLREVVADSDRLISLIAETCVVLEPSRRVEVAGDEADNRLLEAALAAGAELLVTGDAELLALGAFEGSSIVSPREFLDGLGSGGA